MICVNMKFVSIIPRRILDKYNLKQDAEIPATIAIAIANELKNVICISDSVNPSGFQNGVYKYRIPHMYDFVVGIHGDRSIDHISVGPDEDIPLRNPEQICIPLIGLFNDVTFQSSINPLRFHALYIPSNIRNDVAFIKTKCSYHNISYQSGVLSKHGDKFDDKARCTCITANVVLY